MATIRKIVRRNPLSAMKQVAPESGHGFRLLAEAMGTAYDRVAPAAADQMKRQGTEEGREAARRLMGSGLVPPGGDYRSAIKSIESSGGDYSALGPVTDSGDRAYGAYQVMGANIGPWTEKHLGRRMTPQEFLADHDAQDAVFDAEFGSYVQRFGNPQDAASMWFSGRPLSEVSGDTSDGYTTVREYVEQFSAALGDGETIIRTPEGKVEMRMYSPLSGPIRQAHNAAAQVAFLSETLNRASIDITNLVNQHTLDPEGFDRAAQEYIKTVVESAPEAFREDLRSGLENEARRSHLGLVEAEHRDTRARANNQSKALMDRWSASLAEALASGNADEIAVAEENLASILQAREALPGVAWTPAQSENVVIRAQAQAEKIRIKRRQEASSAAERELDLMIDALESGLTYENEAIATDPTYLSLQPELAAKAQTLMQLRDLEPDFWSAPPAERDAALATVEGRAVDDPNDILVAETMRGLHRQAEEAWEKRPIETALQHMPEHMPEVVPFTDDPGAAVRSWAARRSAVNALVQSGHMEAPVFLSGDEADELSQLLAAEQDPVLKAGIAAGLVEAFGPDASRVFRQVAKGDRVLKMGGMLVAQGGDPSLMVEALQGQQLIKDGLVQIPEKGVRIGEMSKLFAEAFQGLPGIETAQGDITAFASALYAAQGQGIDPKGEQAANLWVESLQRAIGQTDDGNAVRGGVQEIFRNGTLLPMGISSAEVEIALSRASASGEIQNPINRMGQAVFDTITGREQESAPKGAWEAAGGEVPQLLGQPLSPRMIRRGDLRLRPVGGDAYQIDFVSGSAVVPVMGSNGYTPFTFDLKKLIAATKRVDEVVPPPPEKLSDRDREAFERQQELTGGSHALR